MSNIDGYYRVVGSRDTRKGEIVQIKKNTNDPEVFDMCYLKDGREDIVSFIYISYNLDKLTDVELKDLKYKEDTSEIQKINNIPSDKGYLPDSLNEEDGYRAFDILKTLI